MDPRIERTRASVMDAATALLLEGGPDALTMDGIVERSGVAKSTLYRHWPTRDALVIAVFDHLTPELSPVAEGLDFDGAVRALVAELTAVLGDEQWQPLIPVLAALKARSSDIAEIDERFHAQQLAVLEAVLALGIAEGRCRADLDAETISMFLVGPILMAALTGEVPLDERFADLVVELFLRAVEPQA